MKNIDNIIKNDKKYFLSTTRGDYKFVADFGENEFV